MTRKKKNTIQDTSIAQNTSATSQPQDSTAQQLTKICKECGRELPLSAYNFWNKKKGTYMTICKDCEKERHQKKHEHKRQILHELKSVGCCICGETEPACLEFHHIDSEHKEFNMGSALTKTDSRIIDEAAKCVVVCANCHRKIHAGVIDVYDYVNKAQYQYLRNLMNITKSSADLNIDDEIP